MKVFIGIILLFCTLPSLWAQPYGNEWIDYSKKYYRIQTAKDALYRLSYADLSNAGFPVTTVDPRRIQLFFRGEEVAIHIEGQNDAVFNTNDYIEFYGRKNDGTLDKDLYPTGSTQPHDLYNIFSDSTSFFLTYYLTPNNGKRMISYSKNNVSNLAAVPFHTEESLQILTDQYAVGKRFAAEDVVQLTKFDTGEGWTGKQIQEGQEVVYTSSGIDRISGTGNIILRVLLQGRDDTPHKAEVLVSPNGSSFRSLGPVSWNDYFTKLFSGALLATDIGSDGSVRVKIRCLGQGGNDLLSTSYIKIDFRQTMNAANQSLKFFTFTGNTGNDAFFQVNNPPASAILWDVSSPSNIEQVGYTLSGGQLRAIVENANTERKLLLTNESLTPRIRKVSMRQIDPLSANYIVISHSILRKAAGGYQDPVAAVAGYRASAVGGGYDTLVMNIQDIYDQYSFGETTPLAIFHFMRQMVNQGNPEYLFIIGKGMDPDVNFYRNTTGYFTYTAFGTTNYLRNLVPSAGQPASDAVFTAGLGDSNVLPVVATGRIPANTPGQVAAYLDKVKEMESQPYDDLYRKNILHLSGGISALELARFNNFVNSFATVAEDKFLGGKVTTIRKNNTEIISLINISEEINSGLNLVTFFGHSAPNVTDIDIGFVTDPALGYNNPDKYPMFLLNGCLAGQFFTGSMVFGEDWINASQKGAIGFLAHTSFGFESALKRYSDIFYRTAYGDSLFIGKSIGQIHDETGRRYMENISESEVNVSQVQQMLLLSDPATLLFGAQKPDYETTSNQLFLTTGNDEPLTGRSDKFILNIITKNFGRAYDDSLSVHVTRVLNDNSSLEYDSVFTAPYYQDTLQLLIPNTAVNGSGNNQFRVELDPENTLPELNENNNSGILNFFIPSNSTENIYPFNYAIVDDQTIELIAQSTDPFPKDRSFTFEIDTSRYFNSPIVQQNTVNANILASWTTTLMSSSPQNDSVVYFWRSKYTTPQEGESDDWVTSSFVYIEGAPEGWSQSVYHQFIENEYSDLEPDEDKRILSLKETKTELFIFTGGRDSGIMREENSLKINGIEYNITGQTCRNNTFNLIAFNKTTAVPYLALPYGPLDPRTCGRQSQIINSFALSEIENEGGLIDYIDAVNEGDVVVAFTFRDPSFSYWSDEIRSKLTEIGMANDEVDGWINGEPVFIIGRKGAPPGSALIIRTSETPVPEQKQAYTKDIIGYATQGTLESSLIGPSNQWNQLIQRIKVKGQDDYQLDVHGVSQEGQETPLLTDVTETTTDLSTIDAVQFPFMKLILTVKDEKDFTAPVLDKWLVTYETAPEGVLIADEVSPPVVSLDEGEELNNQFGFLNISNKSFPDSLNVLYELFNRDLRTTQTKNFRIKSPAPGDTSIFSVKTLTLGNAGVIDYKVYVNPRVTPELYYDNNQLSIPQYLDIGADNINPVIDVVFDGEYILDGDIVSPSPLIVAKVKDNNKFLLKTDTVGMNLLFKQQCQGCEYQRIPFTSEFLRWYPAEEDQPFRLEFRPEKLDDGMYSLRIEASDASGNKAGEEPYEINFQVINESTVTNFYPYPNPFSSNTRFVFTLTGSEIPEEIKIQIMTVSGKVIREITQDELGPIHIGNNLSDYAWDGRDEFGDQLANGVYLYRVLIRNQGEQIDHRATAGDKGFTKGFGKLYLLR